MQYYDAEPYYDLIVPIYMTVYILKVTAMYWIGPLICSIFWWNKEKRQCEKEGGHEELQILWKWALTDHV